MEDIDRIFDRIDVFFDRLFDRSLIQYLPYTAGWRPAMNLYETERSYWAILEIPGMNREHIDVKIESGALVITGVRRIPVPGGVRCCRNLEIAEGPFRRMLGVGDAVDGEGIRARYENGLLLIELPKKGERNAGSAE